MKFKKLMLSLGTISSFGTVATAISCGNKTYDSTEKIEQDNEFKTYADKLEDKWRLLTISSEFKLAKDKTKFEDIRKEYLEKCWSNTEFKNAAYEAFKLYASDKIAENRFYFSSKALEWQKNSLFDKEISKEWIKATKSNLGELEPNKIPSEEIFHILWKVDGTQIRRNIEKMILVMKYLMISDKDTIAKMNENFKYNENLKYDIQNYHLLQYAVKNQYTQLWQRTSAATDETEDPFFIKGYSVISGIKEFNDFIEDSSKNKKLENNSPEKITQNAQDTQLLGYQGFKKNPSEYDLNKILKWSDDDLLKIKDGNKLTGFLVPDEKQLRTLEYVKTNNYVPYKKEGGTPVVAYVNQIVPISSLQEKDLPSADENKKETVKKFVLSFENTPYKDSLKKLCYIFYQKDSSLFKTAMHAYVKLGYKIRVDIDNKELLSVVKDLPFVETKDKDKK
ncbi:HinT-interacting membrane complex lipoprotein P60 [Mycoplasma sp. Mirounga ES2805-ORL]|uniref:HinT-interacting membrane complex lipoprotein P60 n=1 Tax=Mycoplasma sp. Mirounga ES2805-ORL TaxID=754514 RepID=UPI00197B608E|nr:hypothetical protein [Mycoplasma sp. Mirounga ES2805-ORL]QSF13537.1 hypothetical protein JXZ90_02580 [Mycoplasma sp. Mirounga ES2805-ORL]